MIKSNKEVALKTRETHFLYRKPQRLKIAKNVFRKFHLKNENVLSVSRIVLKKRKVARYRRNIKIGVSFEMG